MSRFEGKIAVVTGGGDGIGAAIARRLANEGATVAIVDLDGRAEALADRFGAPAFGLRADVGEASQVSLAFAEIVDRCGRIDVVANNAGISGGSNLLHEQSDETFDQVMRVNLRGAFLVLREAIRVMLDQRSGAIVNTASVGAFKATTGTNSYSTSKGGIITMTRQAGFEYAGRGIRVNAVCPGIIDTRMYAAVPSRLRDEIARKVPMGRVGRPEEVAAAVAFLASDDASYVTGTSLLVDGGIAT